MQRTIERMTKKSQSLWMDLVIRIPTKFILNFSDFLQFSMDFRSSHYFSGI
jgi:hypothetical protein